MTHEIFHRLLRVAGGDDDHVEKPSILSSGDNLFSNFPLWSSPTGLIENYPDAQFSVSMQQQKDLSFFAKRNPVDNAQKRKRESSLIGPRLQDGSFYTNDEQ